MARVPGTEKVRNRRGWTPGDAVRCRRSRANGALGLADRRGLVVEVQPSHVRVLVGAERRSVWLPDQQVVAAESPDDAALALLRTLVRELDAVRVEFEEADHAILFSQGLDADALDRARAALGGRELALAPAGVHEIAVHVDLGEDDAR